MVDIVGIRNDETQYHIDSRHIPSTTTFTIIERMFPRTALLAAFYLGAFRMIPFRAPSPLSMRALFRDICISLARRAFSGISPFSVVSLYMSLIVASSLALAFGVSEPISFWRSRRSHYFVTAQDVFIGILRRAINLCIVTLCRYLLLLMQNLTVLPLFPRLCISFPDAFLQSYLR